MTLLINADRFKEDFDALAQIGATGDGGVHRPALSATHLEARRWFLARAAAAGLETQVDAAGNHSAALAAATTPDTTRTIILGSHLDSVPNGGRFDGALGVVAALEVLRTIKEAGLALPLRLEAVDFTDGAGMLARRLGSHAATDSLRTADLKSPPGGRAELEAGMARAGLEETNLAAAKRPADSLAGYLELHIEQGPRLAAAAVAVGVVSNIMGYRSFSITYRGQAAHAGGISLDTRIDASLGATAFLLSAREMVAREYPDCLINIGRLQLQPGAVDLVPVQSDLSLEFRGPERTQLAELEKSLLGLAAVVGRQYRLKFSIQALDRTEPASLGKRAQAAIAAAADSLALSHMPLVSGVIHDALAFARLTETGVILVPSREGLSCSPQEFTNWDACVNGTNVLLRAALTLAEQ